MALISAGEWIDRYAADADRRSVQDDHDEPPQHLTWRVEVDAPPHESRPHHWRRTSQMPRLNGTFRPIVMRPRRSGRRRR
jgi:hypothetical protein